MENNREKELYIEQEVLDYINFFNKKEKKEIKVLTKERVEKNLSLYQEALNTFLVYPDIFVDIMTPKDSIFSLFFAQRIVLRAMNRHRQSYFTYTRAFSKSFLAFLGRSLVCMFVPRHKAFITAGKKNQAAQIAKEKMQQDIFHKFPMIKRELSGKVEGRKGYIEGGDYAEYRFKNGSIFDVVGGHPRGGRRHSGLFEEIIEQDPTVVNEELIPLMNSPRTDKKGRINPNEPQASKIFVTTAGYQGTFAYNKCIETVCYSVLNPKKYFCLGGSYVIPVLHGRLEELTIREILSSPSYDRDSVEREYISRWSGEMKGAAFKLEVIQSLRKIVRAEYKADPSIEETADFYVITADMAKDGAAATAVIVFRVTPREFMFNFKAVNLFTVGSTDYEIVANELKRTIIKYNAKLFAYDANGIGAALRDWINKPTEDRNTGQRLPGFGIINPPTGAEKDVIKYNKDRTICYELKTGGEKGSRIHRFFFSRISNGSIRFLIKGNEALAKLKDSKSFLKASRQKQREKISPYFFMDKMEEELKNLIITDTSDNVNGSSLRINRKNTKIQKDFFSAAEYGIYATNVAIEKDYYERKQRKTNKMSNFVFIN